MARTTIRAMGDSEEFTCYGCFRPNEMPADAIRDALLASDDEIVRPRLPYTAMSGRSA